jgi:hypothetical protein
MQNVYNLEIVEKLLLVAVVDELVEMRFAGL